jgi:hypothetical protein
MEDKRTERTTRVGRNGCHPSFDQGVELLANHLVSRDICHRSFDQGGELA